MTETAETNTATPRASVPARASADVVATAQTVGRFTVLGRVGAGGMGQVFAAYDPVLDRRVALKLLHANRGPADHDRLVREAKALARLTHPNVVAVHDVGIEDDRIFVAMEYVDGVTLKAWARQQPGRDRMSEALELLRQAGRGLQAAHAQGLVHRDFKPSNVLVGTDGRVRVADFGLARSPHSKSQRETTRSHESIPSLAGDDSRDSTPQDPIERPLTRAGAVVGTPRYMAPEQARGEQVDAKSDQFSFCVAAWEVLFETRPFRFETTTPEAMASLSVEPTHDGEIQLPGNLEAALRKGLARRASGRHRSMEALLAAFDGAIDERSGRPPQRSSRRNVASGAIGLLLVGGLAYQLGGQKTEAPQCTGAASQLAELWNDANREQVRAAILDTGVGHAPRSADAVVRDLDAYADAWIDGHTRACEATRVHAEQSEAMLDLRMTCLARRRRGLRSAVNALRRTEPAWVDDAVTLVRSLDSVETCADLAYVQSEVPLPSDETTRAEVDALRDDLAELRATWILGRVDEAVDRAKSMVARARDIDYPIVLSESLHQQGLIEDRTQRFEDAAKSLREAFFIAERSGADRRAAAIASYASYVVGYRQHELDEGLLWNDLASAAFERSGITSTRLEARILQHRALVYEAAGRYDRAFELQDRGLAVIEGESLPLVESKMLSGRASNASWLGNTASAIADLERALTLEEQVAGVDHPMLADVAFNLALTYGFVGRIDDALALLERAHRIYLASEGESGRNVGSVIAEFARLHMLQGQFERAKGELERAATIFEATIGPKHPEYAMLHHRLGQLNVRLGDYDQAMPGLQRALALFRESMGEDHVYTAIAWSGVGDMHRLQGDLDQAREAYERALPPLRTAHDEYNTAVVLNGLGRLNLEEGALDRAREQFTEALKSHEQASTADGITDSLDGLAQVHEREGDFAEAVRLLERAQTLAKTELVVLPVTLASIRFSLARSSWQATKDPGARALALLAREHYASLGTAEADEVEAIDQWLRELPESLP